MELTGTAIYLDLMRVGHIFSGILWIGILYFYNFIQAIALPRMDASARPHYQTTILPFSLNVFRWASLATLVFGVLLILGFAADQGDAYWDSYQFRNVAIGGVLGIIMAFNVWFIIWPNQQKIIAAVKDTLENGTAAPAEQPKWARTALLASRTNTMLSLPMLFFMVAARHLQGLWA
ncbi:MAG: hypothetical protein CL763_01915 [Chloroflexi bacterium]|nr:hypothetical protein [Chloroflexota bacterium]